MKPASDMSRARGGADGRSPGAPCGVLGGNTEGMQSNRAKERSSLARQKPGIQEATEWRTPSRPVCEPPFGSPVAANPKRNYVSI